MALMNPKQLLFASAAATSLLIALPAAATPTFPDVLRTKLALSTTPDCSLCHSGTPARGNVNTPLGRTLLSRGLVANKEESLRTALDAITAENKDSDGDGVSDITELKAGQNPNAAGEGETVTPEYGCTAAPGRTSSAWSLVALATTLVLLRRTSRPSRSPSQREIKALREGSDRESPR
jgi:hypothetical protein